MRIRLEIPAQVMLAVDCLCLGCITPAAVAILRELEVRACEQPDLGPDNESSLSGGIQPQEGVLGVGVVAGMHRQVIVP